ncbi:MAG: hypothetical protein QM500_19950 [Methylococcales bacterium]
MNNLFNNQSVLLVDQKSIPASFNCNSLFVNGEHILDSDESNAYPLEDVANSLAKALNVNLKEVSLSELDLAKYMSHTVNQSEQLKSEIELGSVDLDSWVQGYTNDDVKGAVNFLPGNNKPLGLSEALKAIDDEPNLKLYEVEIGLINLEDDPSTAFDSHLVVVASGSIETANEQAQFVCEETISVVHGVSFSVMSNASEADREEYK